MADVPVAALPEMPTVTLELDNAQRPERVTADWGPRLMRNVVSALFPGKP